MAGGVEGGMTGLGEGLGLGLGLPLGSFLAAGGGACARPGQGWEVERWAERQPCRARALPGHGEKRTRDGGGILGGGG